MLVGTTAEPTSLAGAVRERVWSLDRNVPVSLVSSLEELLGNQLSARRFNLVLLALFAGLALVLAAAGAHGVLSSDTGRRTREIGIRMALGARPRDVLELVVREGLFPVLLGVISGLAGAFALTGVVSSFLFGVSSTDPVTYLAITLVLGGAALLACYLPARRATRIEPTVALRH